LDKRNNLLGVIKKYKLSIIPINEETENLAKIYIREKVIPVKNIDDARHIA